MKSNYTPGPWTAGKQVIEDDLMVPYVSVRSGNKHIAFVSYGMPPEMMSNARLIAAAPELLAALTKMVEHSELAHWDKLDSVFGITCDHARAAISKAKGPQ